MASQIDMFLVNVGLSSNITNTSISLGCRTDHVLIEISIKNSEVTKGPGVWKFNNQLLSKEKFCTDMKADIQKVKEHLKRSTQSKTEQWEVHKVKAVEFSKLSTKNSTNTRNTLLMNMYRLKDIIVNDELIERKNIVNHDELLEQVNNKICVIEQEKARESMFRARCNYVKHGEKNTSYFFALEKRNYRNKTAFALFIKGSLCKDQKLILEEQRKFYEALYSSNRSIVFDIHNTTETKLTELQKAELETDVTIVEIHTAALSMAHNKVPGSDGLTLEFYLTFWNEIKDLLWAMYQEVLENKKLGFSARRGIISLLPKKNKDPRYVQNLRPLTLLNLDYKLLAKTLALRMKGVMNDIIGPQQRGFMEGWQIQDNIRLTMDLVTYINQTQKCAVIISIDYLNCFDMIEHNAILGAMKYFNFGMKFIGWVSTFFNSFKVCTQNAGHTSRYLNKEWGTNQGCPISPYCFNICGEVMAHLIKNNKKIVGIWVNDGMKCETYHIISQFADDTALFLSFSEECLNAVIQTLMYIEHHTGLTVSYEKTCVYRVGSMRDSNAKIYTLKPLQWSDGDIEILGTTIKNDIVQTTKDFDKDIMKMHTVADMWHNRQLTVLGKVLLINSLMGLLFVYHMCTLPNLTGEQLLEIDKTIIDFLWKGKRSKIPIKILRNPKRKGGLKLNNFELRQKALYIQ